MTRHGYSLGQMIFDIPDEKPGAATIGDNKFECAYGTYSESVDRMRCTKSGALVYTDCHRGIAGDPPHCVYEPLDNSDEAVARRIKWMEEHK